ncbi:general transcription factor 3C polypeptide 6 isoform X2 [Dunckerocampus dactyliophorus]|uniref:general transcription factor 3C polypeptide 6 isoform X2 n=1 Tax=Dunckerocampus dactyliophorus TaxID=161453 RepID=UPI002406C551|nr:general transcription factor 3C polypeptide 6 isoform X2 [Dunckerocampus dactyliophorus]
MLLYRDSGRIKRGACVQCIVTSVIMNMDDEWEEEDQLVVVELSGVINNDILSKPGSTCKILDIDSEQPMMQLGQYVFAGEYEDALGSCILFEEGPGKGKANSGPELKYKCHTIKKLMMQRIFLTDKKENEANIAGGESDKQSDQVCQSDQETIGDLAKG